MKTLPRLRLTEERKRRQWSQQEVADFLGTTQHNISRWEQGQTTPGPYFRARRHQVHISAPGFVSFLANNPRNWDY